MARRIRPARVRTLHPRGTRIAPGKGPTVMLRFDLPIAARQQTVVAHGNLTYITPRSQDEIAFGVHFTKIGSRDKKLLAAFIVESMQPR